MRSERLGKCRLDMPTPTRPRPRAAISSIGTSTAENAQPALAASSSASTSLPRRTAVAGNPITACAASSVSSAHSRRATRDPRSSPVRSTTATSDRRRGPITSSRRYVTRARSGKVSPSVGPAPRPGPANRLPRRVGSAGCCSPGRRRPPPAAGRRGWRRQRPGRGIRSADERRDHTTMPTSAAASSANSARSVVSEASRTCFRRVAVHYAPPGWPAETERRNEAPLQQERHPKHCVAHHERRRRRPRRRRELLDPRTTKTPAPTANGSKRGEQRPHVRLPPVPSGCASAGRPDLRFGTSSRTSLPVSAHEWAASGSSAADPLSTAVADFATATARVAARPTRTVRTPSSPLAAGAGRRRRGTGGVAARAGPATRAGGPALTAQGPLGLRPPPGPGSPTGCAAAPPSWSR